MTTETEPMVRVVSAICERCGFEVTRENRPGWPWDLPFPASVIRRWGVEDAWTEKICGCPPPTRALVATEPVR